MGAAVVEGAHIATETLKIANYFYNLHLIKSRSACGLCVLLLLREKKRNDKDRIATTIVNLQSLTFEMN